MRLFFHFRVPDFHYIFVVHTSDTYDCIIFTGMFSKLSKWQLCVDFSFLGTCSRFWNLLKIRCQENDSYWIFLWVIPLMGRCEHQNSVIGWAIPHQMPTSWLVPCSCVVGGPESSTRLRSSLELIVLNSSKWSSHFPDIGSDSLLPLLIWPICPFSLKFPFILVWWGDF